MLNQPKAGMGSCDPCAATGTATLTMTYAGFGLTGDPNYTPTVSPNGAYAVVWDAARHWDYGSDIVLGVYDDGVNDPFDVILRPAARCESFVAGGLADPPRYNISGVAATMGFNYVSSPLGTPMDGTGSDPIFTPGTLTITLA